MSQSRIHATEKLLKDIFSPDYVFRIPHYQRPYSWGTQQAEQLLDDLVAFMGEETNVDVGSLDPYFLGSIVLIKGDRPEAEVVDGQQRLTTLTILLAALRESISSPQMRAGLTRLLYDDEDVVTGVPAQYRLTLRPKDEDFFRNRIQKAGGFATLNPGAVLPDSQAKIRDNALQLRSRLAEIPEASTERLVQFLAQRCYLVVVSTPDDGSAFRIFAVLNDRGLDLTHADILKAEVVGAIPAPLDEVYSARWEQAEDDLGQEHFKDLFAHMRMIYHPAKLRTTVLEDLRQYVNPKAKPVWFVDEVMLPFAEAYETLLHANYMSTQSADQVNKALTWLRRVDNVDWIPPAMLFLVRHKNEPAELLRFLTDLDRLAYGMMIMRTNINDRINRFAKVIQAIHAAEDLYDPKSPLQLAVEEMAKTVEHLDGPVYDKLPPKVRMAVLLRLDEAVSSGGAKYDYPVVTIEHVLPQTPAPGSQWVTWFATEEERQHTVHRLGNLALLDRKKNAQAGNLEFAKKKQSYFMTRQGTSPFALTTHVLQENEWTPTVFQARQTHLVNLLKGLWRL